MCAISVPNGQRVEVEQREGNSSELETMRPQQPQSWPQMFYQLAVSTGLWPVLSQRRFWLFLAPPAVFVLLYFGLIPWKTTPASVPAQPSVADISGRWTYKCTAVGSQVFDHGGYEHGGEVLIQQSKETFGTAVSIAGERKWIRRKEDNGSATTTTLDNPVHWQTQSGAFTGKDTLLFSYETTGQAGILQGFLIVKIEMLNGQAETIKGTFQYQLPDQKVMWGNVEFQKIHDK